SANLHDDQSEHDENSFHGLTSRAQARGTNQREPRSGTESAIPRCLQRFVSPRCHINHSTNKGTALARTAYTPSRQQTTLQIAQGMEPGASSASQKDKPRWRLELKRGWTERKPQTCER